MLYVLTINGKLSGGYGHGPTEISHYIAVLAHDVCGSLAAFGEVEIAVSPFDSCDTAVVIRAPEGVDLAKLTSNFGELRMLYGEDNVRVYYY
jgi:hypothetical protein